MQATAEQADVNEMLPEDTHGSFTGDYNTGEGLGALDGQAENVPRGNKTLGFSPGGKPGPSMQAASPFPAGSPSELLEVGGAFQLLLRHVEEEHLRELQEVQSRFESELARLNEQHDIDQSGRLAHNPSSSMIGLSSMLVQDGGLTVQASDGADHDGTRSGTRHTTCTTRSSYASNAEQEKHTKHVLYEYLNVKLENIQGRATRNKGVLMSEFYATRAFFESMDMIGKRSRLKRFCQRIVSHHRFELVCISMIFFNAAFIGAITEYEAKNHEETLPFAYKIVARCFTGWFFMELVLRLIAAGPYGFCFSEQWRWNLFDCIIVGGDAVEIMLEVSVKDSQVLMENSTAFRVLRILRVTRALRVIKLVHFFKEFRMMVMSVVRSGMLLLWSVLLLIMIIFIFGIFLTQNVTAYLKTLEAPSNETQGKLEKQFGSLEQAFYTLFKAISGGVSWEEIGDSLFYIDLMNGMVFIFYIFFTVFSLLNIITGIFVDTAISSAQNDHDEVIQAQLVEEESNMRQLTKIFKEADNDQSETVTLSELETHFKNPHVAAHLNSLGIAVNEARALFTLLDADNSGQISIDEFVFGCLRMKGSAKAIDLQTLMYENKRMVERNRRFFKDVINELQRFNDLQEDIQSRLPFRRIHGAPQTPTASALTLKYRSREFASYIASPKGDESRETGG